MADPNTFVLHVYIIQLIFGRSISALQLHAEHGENSQSIYIDDMFNFSNRN